MFSEIYYSKKTGEPVQVVEKCIILPDALPGICFQQMSGEFACYVWDVEHFKANYQKEKVQIKEETEPKPKEEISDLVRGSLTLCLPLDFHNPLQHSPLRLIFLSNFKIFLVIVCHCVV